jgi:hypothetical protein
MVLKLAIYSRRRTRVTLVPDTTCLWEKRMRRGERYAKGRMSSGTERHAHVME